MTHPSRTITPTRFRFRADITTVEAMRIDPHTADEDHASPNAASIAAISTWMHCYGFTAFHVTGTDPFGLTVAGIPADPGDSIVRMGRWFLPYTPDRFAAAFEPDELALTTTTYWYQRDGQGEILWRGANSDDPAREQIARQSDLHPAAWEFIHRGIAAVRASGVAR